MNSEDYLFILALKQCKNIGTINLKKLIKHFGSAKNVWEASRSSLLSISGVGIGVVKDIGDKILLYNAEKEFEFCEKHHIKMVSQNEISYPKNLQQCDDAPVVLFYKGQLNNDTSPISIVGTRKLTAYGKQFIQDLTSDLPPSEVCTVSGLALGADTCVHEESLKNGIPTIAILAQSLDKIYPASNKNLANRIIENNGALISEYASFEIMIKENFLKRNRIIAGFSPQLIVVETAYGGGSITTVSAANHYNRDVFALPGKITDTYSQGCNQLIANSKAESIIDTNTLIKNLNLTSQAELFPKKDSKIELDIDKALHHSILNIISEHKMVSLDEIAEKSGFLHHKLLPILLDLEIYGYVKCLSGRQYQIQ